MTENGYGKRTRIDEYPLKGRGGLGVKTVQLTEARGQLAGALVVRDGYQVMLISTGGTVIRMPVEEVKRLGRATQGVIVMRLREGEQVSTLAPVVEQANGDGRRRAADGCRTAAEPSSAAGQISSFEKRFRRIPLHNAAAGASVRVSDPTSKEAVWRAPAGRPA